MRRKNLIENDVPQSTKMGSLLQKLRDAQQKTLKEKSAKWGFNFERCMSAENSEADIIDKTEFEKKSPVESTTSVVIPM